MVSKRKHIPEETFIAAASLFETLFNKRTIGQRDENTSTVLIDTFKDTYLHDSIKARNQSANIILTMDVIFLIGWRQHES